MKGTVGPLTVLADLDREAQKLMPRIERLAETLEGDQRAIEVLMGMVGYLQWVRMLMVEHSFTSDRD